jgi:geranylgeranyl reductase family protein
VNRCDALVVGGGPAGSTCARELARAGLDVLVLDKAAFPRDKPCAGWITPGVLETLGLSVRDYGREGRTLQPILGFRTGVVGGRDVLTRYDGPVSYGIRRCEFDQYLLRRSGARVVTGHRVSDLRWDGEGWIVDGEIRTPLLVGAGGHFCPVARILGHPEGDEPVVAAQEVEFRLEASQEAECPVRPDTPELYFCADLAGYGWCFRKGRYLNVGLGRRDRRELPEQVRAFVAFLERRRRVPPGLPPRFRGHAYLLYERASRRLVDRGVLLVGDAAGLAYPASGEGIRTAVESGVLAARAVLAAGGCYARDRLEPYRTALEARLGPRRRGLDPPRGAAAAVGRWLLGAEWFTRRVLLDRWFLHRDQRPLAPAA